MREQQRIKRIMDKIYVIWLKHPDMRFGQLYENLLVMYSQSVHKPFDPRMMWNVEDVDFELFLDGFRGFE